MRCRCGQVEMQFLLQVEQTWYLEIFSCQQSVRIQEGYWPENINTKQCIEKFKILVIFIFSVKMD